MSRAIDSESSLGLRRRLIVLKRASTLAVMRDAHLLNLLIAREPRLAPLGALGLLQIGVTSKV